MTATIVIGGVIGVYCAWVLRKKYRDMKEGKSCCGCDGGCKKCGRR